MKSLLVLLCLTLSLRAAEPTPDNRMAESAAAFLAQLDPAQRAKAALPFESDERENFHFTPRERAGLPLKEMTDKQREASTALLETALSDQGKLKISQIMILEGILAEIEKNPVKRDPGKYAVVIFVTPGDPKGWGWRYEGHHVSMSFTLVEGKKISLTPSFLGSNPGEVRQGPHTKLRVLAAEEELARSLVTSLVSSGKSAVIFSEKTPTEILSAEERNVTVLDPVGIPCSEMTEAQKKGLIAVISEYTGRCRKELADADRLKIEKAGLDKIRFAWSGSLHSGEAYYYRVQGPTFLIEAINFQNDANHVHAVWRDLQGDFGRDILAEHLKQEH